MYCLEDTIAAQATPPGKSAIAVIRISGARAAEILKKCLIDFEEEINPRRATLANLGDEEGVIDQVIVIYFPAPGSYTGEDLVEIHCHGGEYIARRILNAICKNGARPAEPGEFTLRAFLNGKMDLTQAEAIADLISVESERARRNALSQLYGGLKREIVDIREGILNLLAELEVEIEFPDDEPMEANYSDWLEKTESLRKKIQKLVNRGISGRTIREGFRITIAGPPNSGKSTLLNALLGEDRAIVHNQPGTTRDILREAVEIEGIKIWLSDTAGLRNEAGEIEQEGIARAQKEIDTSDLTLYLIDLNNPVDDGFRFENKNMLKVGNKVDLTPGDGISCDLKISALKSIGLEQLKETIAEKALLNCSDSGVIANERHLKNLRSALKYVSEAKEIIAKKGETELIALELRSAGLSLGEIIGEGVTEEVLEKIFSRFCIGK